MTRLDRLRRMREGLEQLEPGKRWMSAGDLWRACAPDKADEARQAFCKGVGRYPMLAVGREEEWIDDPLLTVDGALWLARQALPGWLVEMSYPPNGDSRVFLFGPGWLMLDAQAPTLPIAICRAVVAALIALEERAEGLRKLARLGQEFDAS